MGRCKCTNDSQHNNFWKGCVHDGILCTVSFHHVGREGLDLHLYISRLSFLLQRRNLHDKKSKFQTLYIPLVFQTLYDNFGIGCPLKRADQPKSCWPQLL